MRPLLQLILCIVLLSFKSEICFNNQLTVPSVTVSCQEATEISDEATTEDNAVLPMPNPFLLTTN